MSILISGIEMPKGNDPITLFIYPDEKRKAMLRIAMYNRYGVIPSKNDLRDDVLLLGLDKDDYSELFDGIEEG